MRSFLVFAFTTLGALATASAAPSDVSDKAVGAPKSLVSYSHGHFSTFKPVAAGFAVDPALTGSMTVFISEDPDFCAHSKQHEALHGSKTLVFSLRSQANGIYAIDLLRAAWGKDNAFAAAEMLVYDDRCVNVGDARHLGQPSIMPFGTGTGDSGWIRVEKDASGASSRLSAEYGVSLGAEGFPATLLKGLFNAAQCAAPLTGQVQSCL